MKHLQPPASPFGGGGAPLNCMLRKDAQESISLLWGGRRSLCYPLNLPVHRMTLNCHITTEEEKIIPNEIHICLACLFPDQPP